jgi:hypothetical protein
MSLVGPRPTLQVQVDRYTDRQRRRLEVRPGLTGWAQVNGRASLPWPERIELDIWYLEHATLRLDLKILAASARMAVTGHGRTAARSAAGASDYPGAGERSIAWAPRRIYFLPPSDPPRFSGIPKPGGGVLGQGVGGGLGFVPPAMTTGYR